MSETSSEELGPIKLVALTAATLLVAFGAVAAVIVLMCAITPEAPAQPPQAIVYRPAVKAPESRAKPLLVHLKRLHKPIKRRRAKH